MKNDLAPLRNKTSKSKPWQGSDLKKPWHYPITVVIPCLETFELVETCVELLRLQTVKPFITVIDTGSSPNQLRLLQALRAEDLEVHSIALNGVRHPSDFPAIAMDLAFSMCRTQFIFATHADCFLRRRNFLEYMLDKCKDTPVVGYEMSPRRHEDWKGMVSHTATMYHMPTMDKIGFGWSLRRLCNLYDLVDYSPSLDRPNWPDTEILGNYILRQHNIEPELIGSEENFSRQVDDNIDHFRSYTSGLLYNEMYHKQATIWYEAARAEALERIERWTKEEEEIKNEGENR